MGETCREIFGLAIKNAVVGQFSPYARGACDNFGLPGHHPRAPTTEIAPGAGGVQSGGFLVIFRRIAMRICFTTNWGNSSLRTPVATGGRVVLARACRQMCSGTSRPVTCR